MRVFHCSHCDRVVFFENSQCIHCGHMLAYLPDVAQMASLDPLDGGLWSSRVATTPEQTYRQCANYVVQQPTDAQPPSGSGPSCTADSN
ncbi:MAG: zinc-ribbon domain-containing protein [Acidobacteriota bacterium]